MGGMTRDAFDHDARNARARILRGLAGNTVVSDHRKSKRENLPGVRRIGDRFFVTRHARVENSLAQCQAFMIESHSVEARAVGQEQSRAVHRALRAPTRPFSITTAPATMVVT